VAPIVTLNGASSLSLVQGTSYTEEGAVATDDIDQTLTPVISGTVDTGSVGTYTITYTATDSSGNTGSSTREVTVTASTVAEPVVVEPVVVPTEPVTP